MGTVRERKARWAFGLVLGISACSIEERPFGSAAGGTDSQSSTAGGSGESPIDTSMQSPADMPDASLTDLEGEGSAFCDSEGNCSCNADAQSCAPLSCDGGGSCGEVCPGCMIDGVCVGAGVTDPGNVCLICKPEVAPGGWSNNDGVTCDDAAFCTVEDTCQQGACTGAPRVCEDGVDCNGESTCDEAQDRCTPDVNQCANNELCNTATDSCSTMCTGCVIGSTCVQPGAAQTDNPCMVCNPARSATAFTPELGKTCGSGPGTCSAQDTCNAAGACEPNHSAEGTACGNAASNECNLPDTCDGRGNCLPRLVANDTPCNDGLFCSVGDECQGGGCVSTGARNCGAGLGCNETADRCECQGCTVSNNCFAAAATNGSNPCQVCDPMRSRTAFSNNVNALCGAGASECSAQDTCNAQGICAPNHLAFPTACSSVPRGQCQGDGRCVSASLAALGDPCTTGSQCDSGSCVNSVCCGSPSCGSCERCGQGGVCRTSCANTERCTNNVCVDPLRGRPPILVSALAQGGSSGFPINGAQANDQVGVSVSGGGDVNADGRPDILIATSSPRMGGLAYVVFGSNRTTPLSLSAVEAGQGGYVITGAGGTSPTAIANAGDVNGDGRADIIVIAQLAAGTGGSAVVVFGQTQTTPVALAPIIAGQGGGFAINGPSSSAFVGSVVGSAGDVNGDGRSDLVVGMNGNGACVVFGKTNTAAVSCGAPGAQGFLLAAAQTGDNITGVAGADVNGDGLSDVLLGTRFVDRLGNQNSGVAHVVFGKTSTAAVQLSAIEAGQGGGFVIHAAHAFDFLGAAIARAGDLNADGRSDVVIGAPGAPGNSATPGGRAYVVFGKTSAAPLQLSAIEGGQGGGFMIDGVSVGYQTGNSVAGLGDVNGDGVEDVLISAENATPRGVSSAGASYLVYGKADTAAVSLTALENGQRGGFVIQGVESFSGSQLGAGVAGDQNGDGLRDLLIGRSLASPGGSSIAGSVTVVFGAR